jgi:hypothetical protein
MMTDTLTETAAEIGHIRRFNSDPESVLDEISRHLPDGIGARYTRASTIPDGAVAIGTVRVRQADPALTLYLFRRGPGRPEIGRTVNVRMSDELINRLDAEAARHSATRAETIRSMLWEHLYERRTGRLYTDPVDAGIGTDEEEGI